MHFLRTTLFGHKTAQAPAQPINDAPIETGAICLVTGLSTSAVIAYHALPAQVAAGIEAGAAIAEAQEAAADAALDMAEDVVDHVAGGAGRASRGIYNELASLPHADFPWPSTDLDSFSTTDLEDLAVFAADVFEFVQQEYAILVAAYGESRVVTTGALLAYVLYRQVSAVVSAFRLK